MGSASRSEAALTHWWTRAMRTATSSRTDDVLEELKSRHREAHRQYHTSSHVLWVLRHADSLAGEHPVGDLSAVFAAAFFHDAIYDPAASEPGANERASAELATERLTELDWSPDRVAHVATMIDATASHELANDAIDTRQADAAVLLDADLAVLGADTAAYGTYVTGVRAEYNHVDDDRWRTGRGAVLDDLLSRPAIYATEPGRSRWEARARANVTAELMSLRGSAH